MRMTTDPALRSATAMCNQGGARPGGLRPPPRAQQERGRAAQLRTFLQEQGGRIGFAADESSAVLRQDRVPLLTRDRRLRTS
jgi:hypothetical protein